MILQMQMFCFLFVFKSVHPDQLIDMHLPLLSQTAVPSLAVFDLTVQRHLRKDICEPVQRQGCSSPASWPRAADVSCRTAALPPAEVMKASCCQSSGGRYKCIFSNYAIALSCLFSIWES